jgi:MSHA biogenesis protein MshO
MNRQRGFTLIEVITVIVIAGILAAMTGSLITLPVRGYFDLQRRTTLVDNAETALRLMQRDIRRALPNSLRITADGTALELLHTVDGGRYRAKLTTVGSGDVLDFTRADTGFDVIGSLSQAPTGDVVVYNLGQATADAYAGNNRATIAATATTTHIDLAAGRQFPMQSPQQRFFIVDTPITFACDLTSGQLIRYDAYLISAGQNNPPANANAALLANQVSACSFHYSTATQTRAGLVTLQITLTDDSGESTRLIQQIHVDNTP